MGFPMANHLLTKSSQLTSVYDVSPGILNSFSCLPNSSSLKPPTLALNPAQVASQCSVLFTMLPEGKHVKQVYLGKGGILEGLLPGTICIDSSTIDVKTTKEVAQRIHDKGGILIDAPVSGG